MNKDSFLARLAIATAISSQMVAGAWADETAATALASTTGAASSAQASALFSRAPYLQLSTPNSMFIVWRTSQSMDAAVKFGRQMDGLDQSSASIEIRQTVADKHTGKSPLHSAPAGTFQYEAKLTGLDPDTVYYYAIYDGETRLTPEDESYHLRRTPRSAAIAMSTSGRSATPAPVGRRRRMSTGR